MCERAILLVFISEQMNLFATVEPVTSTQYISRYVGIVQNRRPMSHFVPVVQAT